MPNTTRRDALKGCAALSSLLLASCSDKNGTPASSASGGLRPLGKGDLTPLERQFGIGPSTSAAGTSNQYMKVRPDVHLVEQGPRAIRAVSANGLSWTLDPKITGPIETGRVLFVTNRCAGRVLAARPAGDQVEVILGPADLTDYIDEAKISMEEPIDFSQAQTYEAPDYPGAVWGPGGAPAPRASHAVLTRDDWRGGFQRVDDDVETDPQFKITPFMDPTTLGVQITSLNDVIQMLGDARLRFSGPKLAFELGIGGSKILNAKVRLSGVAALLITFRAHSKLGVNGNVRTRHYIPVDCSFPLGGTVIPFAATMRHVFLLETAFSSKGNVDATGQYALEGALEMTFGGDGLKIAAPAGFSTQRSLAKSTSGVTMGPAGLILAHQMRAIVGIGAFGFVTGPYVGVTSTAGVTKGSSAGMTGEQCREATLRMSMHGGVGYQIPTSVANAINSVLSIFHVKGIPAEGGFSTSDQTLVNKTEHYPDLKACRSAEGTA